MQQLISLIFSSILLLMIIPFDAFATPYYIRKGASGSNNGSSWENAWNEMDQANTGGGGDTVYIAAGDYTTQLLLRSGVSSESRLIYIRATAAAHGPSEGWDIAYDGQVNLNVSNTSAYAIDGRSDYVTVDGVTRYGIHVRGGTYHAVASDCVPGECDYVTYRYIWFDGSDGYSEDSMLGKGSGFLAEYCYFLNYDNGVRHGDTWSWYSGSDITLRYNVFENGGQYISMGTAGPDLNIYGNIFISNGGEVYNGIIVNDVSGTVNIYNNTFDSESVANNGYDQVFRVVNGSAPSSYTGVYFRNNAIRRANASNVQHTTHNNNAYESGTTWSYPSETGRVVAADLGFVDPSTQDYHLESDSPLRAAADDTIGAEYNTDFDEVARGISWDIGAYEYDAGGAPSIIKKIMTFFRRLRG